ncbi:glycoside hydrolase family 3 protein [Phlebiopsis gigantea 11061_1 CR5-6]|uniref:beta-glucosidase n=1 Tax=Phlebiopsis gigantea (strain 11061_1 CR5-6) TaxID=745531 RepID=A0A0C3P3V6_PHLG1|nr:glycoside hydrolase family 3 protein [Phlebiopsis gigantea 11061_1 CR5-6]
MQFIQRISGASETNTAANEYSSVNSPEWTSAYSKAKTAVAKLSLQDKVSLATGVGFFSDSALGVRGVDLSSAFPAGINAAATFNRSLINQRGVAMGQEFRGKGVHVQLGPYMNMMRAPESGRAWEGFGGDPYLSGEGAYETIIGIQSQGVQAVAKHFINNEQEHYRTTSSSNVDDSIQANVAAVMCSYNQINGSYACENNSTLNGLLKTELAFQGYVMSDWYATHSTSPAANNGLDMTMPGDILPGVGSYFGDTLVLAVDVGDVEQSRIDDMATRILAGWYLLGQDSGYPAVNFNSKDTSSSENQHVNVQGDHASLIRTIGAASTVLLKNTGGVLPLNKPRTVAVIGDGARSNPNGPNSCTDRSCDSGVLAMGWGSGTANFPYLIAPVDAITNRSAVDGTNVTSSLSDSDLTAAAKAAAGKDVAFVFITADSGEDGYIVEFNSGDRNDLFAWHSGDKLVEAVAAVNNNTIVVVNAVGPIITDAWIEHPNVTGLVWSGNALVDVLYGAYNPSGRLPFTIAKAAGDYPAAVDTTFGLGTLQIAYSEGLFIDYRHFDSANVAPRFEFGFGLSYTTFAYSNLKISGSITSGPTSPPNGFGTSLDSSLHEKVVTVTFSIQNTGRVAGHESPQLYLSLPASANSPPQLLKGFDSVFVPVGGTTSVSMQLSRYDFSIWDVVSQRWSIPAGTIGLSVGASSRDIRLKGSVSA